jgi:hypothetical protein
MGHMDGSNFSRVKWKDINKSSEKILSSIGLEIDPKNYYGGLINSRSTNDRNSWSFIKKFKNFNYG